MRYRDIDRERERESGQVVARNNLCRDCFDKQKDIGE